MSEARTSYDHSAASAMRARVHVFDTGTLTANATFLRGEGFASLLRRVEPVEFPALAYVLERPDGLVVVDTGLGAHTTAPRRLRGFPPAPAPGEELGPQMRARGLDPAAVHTVILTHLDWDHTGGLHHFPRARVLVHRREHDFARTRIGRARYRPELWPRDFAPEPYDLVPEPFGPFPETFTPAPGLRILPVPGHSPGQVAVACDAADVVLLFAADHMLRADWFAEDLAAGRDVMLGAFGKRAARATTRRLAELVRSRPTVLLPAHDAGAPRRLDDREVTVLA